MTRPSIGMHGERDPEAHQQEGNATVSFAAPPALSSAERLLLDRAISARGAGAGR